MGDMFNHVPLKITMFDWVYIILYYYLYYYNIIIKVSFFQFAAYSIKFTLIKQLQNVKLEPRCD